MVPERIRNYCTVISGDAGPGSEQYDRCIKLEISARDRLKSMRIPRDVATYCERISKSTGGSYQVMLTCIVDELE